MLFGITADYLHGKKPITFEGEMIHEENYKDLKSNTSENEYSYLDQLLKVNFFLKDCCISNTY